MSEQTEAERLKSPIRDKPCLASATPTFGRNQFVWWSGVGDGPLVSGISFFDDQRSGVYFRLVLDYDVSGYGIKRILESQGHDVKWVKNGQEAVKELELTAFDLVMMDIQMPIMDGLEAIERLRRGDCGDLNSKVPVIALTAFAMKGDREKFLEAGADEYIPKPISGESILETISKYSEKKEKEE